MLRWGYYELGKLQRNEPGEIKRPIFLADFFENGTPWNGFFILSVCNTTVSSVAAINTKQRGNVPGKIVFLRSEDAPATPQGLIPIKHSSSREVLAWCTRNGHLFLLFSGMRPVIFIPPIHFSDVGVFGKVLREPCFIAKWDKIRDIWAKSGNCIDVEVVIVRATIS